MLDRAVAYVRVSQEDETPENQKLAIEEWARRHNLEVVGFFVDEAVSGAVPPRGRPHYKAMLDFTRHNNVKTIVFYDVSRLGRNLEETLYELKKLLEEGYTVYFVYPDFLNQINDPMMKKFVVSMFAWFAELYRYDIIQRTKAGLERARRQGKHIGRRPVEIPVHLVKKYMKMGLSKKDIYSLLVGQGHLRYREKGEERVLSYDRFLKRLKQLGL